MENKARPCNGGSARWQVSVGALPWPDETRAWDRELVKRKQTAAERERMGSQATFDREPIVPGRLEPGWREVARRVELARRPQPEGARNPALRFLLGELGELGEPIRRALHPPLAIAHARNRRVVVLLPGFGTSPWRMRYMARQLERAGHTVKRWGMGFNLGVSPELFERLSERIRSIHERYGESMMLVGWSLGGVFARELAKRHPDLIGKVITMGSPFSGSPYDNNAWRIYHLVAGHPVDAPPVEAQLSVKPPVETVAIWSPRDGIVSPRASCGQPGERDRAIAVRCTHVGFPNSPECIRAVLAELDRSE
jgi:pimeloyl-ACP methyl ester carboxylesterase